MWKMFIKAYKVSSLSSHSMWFYLVCKMSTSQSCYCYRQDLLCNTCTKKLSINIPAVWFQQQSYRLWILHCFRGSSQNTGMSIYGKSCCSNLETRTSLSAKYNKYTGICVGDIAAGKKMTSHSDITDTLYRSNST